MICKHNERHLHYLSHPKDKTFFPRIPRSWSRVGDSRSFLQFPCIISRYDFSPPRNKRLPKIHLDRNFGGGDYYNLRITEIGWVVYLMSSKRPCQRHYFWYNLEAKICIQNLLNIFQSKISIQKFTKIWSKYPTGFTNTQEAIRNHHVNDEFFIRNLF